MSLDVNISEPDEFNCTELHCGIKEVAKIKGIEDFEYHVEYISGNGQNFIANVFRVKVKENGNEESSVSVIVKTLINTTKQKLFHELHKREVTVYEEVMPKFKEAQENLDINDRVLLPECLFSSTETGNEIIILEDLLVKGFQIDEKLTRRENLNYDEVSLVLTDLAKFHALTFVIEKKYPEYFKEIKTKFNDLVFQDSFLNKSKLRSYFSDSYNMSLNVISDMNAKKSLVKVETKLLPVIRSYLQPQKHNVFCHGDCWINNVLFKYEEDKPNQTCFVDFQAMRYTSAVSDIIYFLYICTDSTFRSNHFQDLQNVYYESLKTFLTLHNIDSNEVYPREAFDNDVTEYLPYGLLLALLELKAFTTTLEDEAILKGSNIIPGLDTTEVPGEIDLFKIRVNDVVTESVDNGVLDRLIEKING